MDMRNWRSGDKSLCCGWDSPLAMSVQPKDTGQSRARGKEHTEQKSTQRPHTPKLCSFPCAKLTSKAIHSQSEHTEGSLAQNLDWQSGHNITTYSPGHSTKGPKALPPHPYFFFHIKN